ncbi:carotenoid ester lipase-like protein precursor [Aspergillus fijiensis CBS 313.89]|uniref:Carboxylic ester hydrolase n=1 Tax=Aspergillus fijiensis CBS 313.89 TaxID=1448319 RepID=A0A8G1RG21_9EURO|nr:carotenoid ester lipase-like protein precursor [Aspergillus fijiensis CBS 313.89]RAK72680.1 carotenoid ester lipase-like protein precursor [Aspergillus fijiensis CBS 313.89]
MRSLLSVLPYLFISVSGLVSGDQLRPPPEVAVKNGTLVGVHNPKYGQDFFLGIPYALPPVGDLRYRHPQAVNESWAVKSATEYGAWCHSAPLTLPGFSQKGFSHAENEDCLTLNVVRPSGVHDFRKLPVLVWIHGGGLQEGGSADQRYNMSSVVQESVRMGTPIIGVSFNYRLSGFGFLTGRAVNESGIANLGLYDQRKALFWIQENIAAFGGDPSQVTISGESSGGISVGHHFLAFGGRDDGLFSGGIAESGGPLTPSALISLDQQDVFYEKVLNQTNCTGASDTIDCLRAIPAEILKLAFQGVSYYPVVDGALIEGLSSTALQEGRFVKRPLLTGSNTNEGTAFSIPAGIEVNNATDFSVFAAAFDTGHGLTQQTINDLATMYIQGLSNQEVQADLGSVSPSPGSSYGSLWGRATLYLGDSMFHAGRRYATEMWRKYGVPSYSYRFNAVPNGIDPKLLGATHFQEIPFVFRNFDGVGYVTNPLSSASSASSHKYDELAVLMSRMWISFAVNKSPNSHKVPNFKLTWPTYNTTAKNMVFGLEDTHLEDDTWRSQEIGRIISAFEEYKI